VRSRLADQMNEPDWPIDQDVYTGFWINRSLGAFRGATITLNQQVGGFAIAFIALFVGATARSCWTLTRFALHTSYATSTGQDGVYHQRQAILRNTSLAYDAAFQALRLSLVWRHRAQRAWTRVVSVLFAAVAISAASIAAGSRPVLTCKRLDPLTQMSRYLLLQTLDQFYDRSLDCWPSVWCAGER
jgi:hypothetical protein